MTTKHLLLFLTLLTLGIEIQARDFLFRASPAHIRGQEHEAILIDTNNFVWVRTDKNLVRFDGGTFKLFGLKGNRSSKAPEYPYPSTVDSIDALIDQQPTLEELFVIIPGTQEKGIRQTSFGYDYYWIPGEEIRIIVPAVDLEYAIPRDRVARDLGKVKYITFDEVGGAWVLGGKGFAQYVVQLNPFMQYQLPVHELDSFESDKCWGMWVVDGALYVNRTHSPMVKIDLQTAKMEEVRAKPYQGSGLAQPVQGYWGGRHFMGSLFMAGKYHLGIYQTRSKKLQKVYPEEPPKGRFISVGIRQDLSAWLGTNKGELYGWFGPDQPLVKWDSLENPLPEEAKIYQISGWLSDLTLLFTSEGVYEVHHKDHWRKRYWDGGKGQYYLPHNHVTTVAADDKGMFWLGTYDHGLIRWEFDYRIQGPSSSKTFGKGEGISEPKITNLMIDNKGILWIHYRDKILAYDPESGNRWEFGRFEGIDDFEFVDFSHTGDAEGWFYGGGENKVIAYQPEELLRQTGPFGKLWWTNLRQYVAASESVEDRMVPLVEEGIIHLAHGDHIENLSFQLVGGNPSKAIFYHWRFLDLDGEWTKLDLFENSLEFTDLEPDTYTLEVRAMVGQIEVDRLALQIIVEAPFWKQRWFIIAVSGILSLILVGIPLLRSRIRKRKKIV